MDSEGPINPDNLPGVERAGLSLRDGQIVTRMGSFFPDTASVDARACHNKLTRPDEQSWCRLDQ